VPYISVTKEVLPYSYKLWFRFYV